MLPGAPTGDSIALHRYMRPTIKLAISAGVFGAVLFVLTRQPVSALPDYTEKERKECDFCHPGGDLFALNEAGRYYAEHNHSLEGYEDKPTEPPKPDPKPSKPKPAEPKPEAPDQSK